MWKAASVICLALPAAAQDLTVPQFTEETATSGIASRYMGDWEYMVGGGVAAFDCSGDKMPDLAFAGGTAPASLYVNRSTPGGALSFEPVQSGLELEAVTGTWPLDVDSDGVMDLVLLRQGENVVMRGLGGCKFERANEAWGFDGGSAWSASFAATFEKGASWPTLAVGNYIDPAKDEPWGSCTDNWLHRPNAAGDGFAPPLPLTPSYCALSMLFTDWNRSGTPSLRVSNDREYYRGGQEQMWHVMPGEAPALYTEKEGWARLRIWGMGIASADVSGDGFPDYFLTSMADNKLQVLKAGPEKPGFADVAFKRGATAHRPYTGGDLRPSTAWHAQFDDVNNDGVTDLFIAKGNVAEMPDFAAKDPNNLLLQGPDGKFVEVGDKAGVASMFVSRGGAVVDLNLDGKLDLVVTNRWEPAQVWRNTSEGLGHWVQIALRQPGVNREAIGAWIELRVGDAVQRREITSGGGHASGLAGWWHFGLGASDAAEVRVIWPDGSEGPWEKLAGDGFYVAAPGAALARWTPGG